jgi:hypothetical protein
MVKRNKPVNGINKFGGNLNLFVIEKGSWSQNISRI